MCFLGVGMVKQGSNMSEMTDDVAARTSFSTTRAPWTSKAQSTCILLRIEFLGVHMHPSKVKQMFSIE